MFTAPTQDHTTALTPTPVPTNPIKYQRLLRGWSQGELAAQIYALCVHDGRPLVSITRQTIYNWEKGRTIPTPLYRKHLCEIFSLNALQLGFLNGLHLDQHLSDNPPVAQDSAQ